MYVYMYVCMYVCKIDKIAKMDKTLAREDKTNDVMNDLRG